MPQLPDNKKTIPQVLIDLFRDVFGDQFHSYYEGDPIIFGESYLPALVVSEYQTDYEVGPTGFDDISHKVRIQVVYNKKDDFGKPDNAATCENIIEAIAQGRNKTTGDFVTNSIMGVLRRNLTIGGIAIENISGIRKGIVSRSELLTTAEAHVELTLNELQSIANRQ